MKVEIPNEKREPVPMQQASQEQRVEFRQVEGGGTKKTIKPKIIQTF